MSYNMVDIAANLFFDTFGDGRIMAIVIIGIFMLLMLALRANLATILLVLIPMILTFIVAPKTTNFLSLPPYVYPAILLSLGVIVSVVMIANFLKN